MNISSLNPWQILGWMAVLVCAGYAMYYGLAVGLGLFKGTVAFLLALRQHKRTMNIIPQAGQHWKDVSTDYYITHAMGLDACEGVAITAASDDGRQAAWSWSKREWEEAVRLRMMYLVPAEEDSP